MANTLKFGSGTWATKKGSTLAYNDENNNYKPLPFTTTRNSIGTRVNKEGLIEVVGNDVPRIDYTDSADGVLLLEKAATNLVTYSQLLNTYLSSKLDTTITDNYGISPDGSLNSSRIQFADDTSYCYTGISVSTSHTVSCYVKGVKGEIVRFGIGSTIVTGSLFTFNGEWQRIQYTTSSATQIFFSNYSGATTRDFEVFGLQLESGNASSYIPTQGSAVTRQADTANGAGNSEVFNDSQGVLFANMSFNLEDSYPNLSIFNNTNATKTDNKIVIYKGATNSNQISVALRSGGSEYANITANVNVENYNKIVISYKSNEVKYYLNGFLIGTDNTVTVPIGLDTLNFDNGAGANDVYGKTKEVAYYDTVLTDLELETLTSYRSLNELVTELNLKAL